MKCTDHPGFWRKQSNVCMLCVAGIPKENWEPTIKKMTQHEFLIMIEDAEAKIAEGKIEQALDNRMTAS